MFRNFIFIFGCILTSNVLAISWVDLPKGDLIELTFIKESPIVEINSLLQKYNGIDKTKYRGLSFRINYLQQIEDTINKYNKGKELAAVGNKSNILRSLKSIAGDKKEYLIRLKELYAKNKTDKDLFNEFYAIDSNFKNETLYLTKKNMYAPSKKATIGDFWLESIDPCHRKLKPYWDNWKNLPEGKPVFFLWLEEQILADNYPTVKYLSVDELNCKHRLFADENDKFGKYFLTNDNEEYLFAIMPNNSIYAVVNTAGFHHTSLSLGKPIIGAGNLKLEKGKIVELFLNSGHYLPGFKNYQVTIDTFTVNNIRLEKNIVIKYFDGGETKKSSLGDFLTMLRVQKEPNE